MLQPTTALVNGILVLTGSQHFVPGLAVRPNARQLRDRRNAVYAEATRSGDPDLGARMVNAHVAAEDYTIRVCEAVLGPRLVAYVEAHTPKPEPTITVRVTKGPRKARKAAPVAHSTECADICICGSQR